MNFVTFRPLSLRNRLTCVALALLGLPSFAFAGLNSLDSKYFANSTSSMYNTGAFVNTGVHLSWTSASSVNSRITVNGSIKGPTGGIVQFNLCTNASPPAPLVLSHYVDLPDSGPVPFSFSDKVSVPGTSSHDVYLCIASPAISHPTFTLDSDTPTTMSRFDEHL